MIRKIIVWSSQGVQWHPMFWSRGSAWILVRFLLRTRWIEVNPEDVRWSERRVFVGVRGKGILLCECDVENFFGGTARVTRWRRLPIRIDLPIREITFFVCNSAISHIVVFRFINLMHRPCGHGILISIVSSLQSRWSVTCLQWKFLSAGTADHWQFVIRHHHSFAIDRSSSITVAKD